MQSLLEVEGVRLQRSATVHKIVIEYLLSRVDDHASREFRRRQALAANVCVTGSLYLVGEALAVLDGKARDAVSDYR
jgi:folylpolyglutamate synthase/dihydropteroate synthase